MDNIHDQILRCLARLVYCIMLKISENAVNLCVHDCVIVCKYIGSVNENSEMWGRNCVVYLQCLCYRCVCCVGLQKALGLADMEDLHWSRSFPVNLTLYVLIMRVVLFSITSVYLYVCVYKRLRGWLHL